MSTCRAAAVIALQAALIGYDADRTAAGLWELRAAIASARRAGVDVAAVLERTVAVLCTDEQLRRIADAA
ncbi:hypothetical protein ACFYO1_16925 [Nocardia sp. NPDC006044]|uniref:hypothetical protein n=1 Tax=Nocardia sp. NPDC006044 TaxID=3364306 RepID=UPI0036926959